MMVVIKFPKKEGPGSDERHPLPRFGGSGVFKFRGLREGAGAMKGTILFRMALVEYKKALLKYAPIETYSAGIELTGREVKALRSRMGSLEGARVVVRGGEAYVLGMTIPPYQVANAEPGYDPERSRRLLLSKAEIGALADAESKKGLTIVPLEVYNSKKFIKVRVAIVKGKTKVDRREDLKKRDALRETQRILKREK